jgi:hypothetical protein
MIFIAGVLVYCIIARAIYSYIDASSDEYIDSDFKVVMSMLWPLTVVWRFGLKYPFAIADWAGNFVGKWQLEFANRKMEKQLRTRQELEEANRQLRIELERDPLLEQFDELERRELVRR